jgi:hypothetical protein
MNRKLKIWDLLLYFIIIIINLYFLFLFNKDLKSYPYDQTVYIKYKNKVYTYNLKENREIRLKNGNIIIKIVDNKVGVIHNDCPNQLCVLKGFISKTGDSIYCVPNGLIIKIVGKQNDKDIDSISY